MKYLLIRNTRPGTGDQLIPVTGTLSVDDMFDQAYLAMNGTHICELDPEAKKEIIRNVGEAFLEKDVYIIVLARSMEEKRKLQKEGIDTL